MIHYTLLPEKEALELRREYRIRIFIVLTFFVSCAVMIGCVSLFPAYITSSIQEREQADKLITIQKNKEARGVDITLRELSTSNEILTKLKQDDQQVYFSNVIQEIVALRSVTITFNSIQISNIKDDKDSSIEVVLQGKSSSRESLLDFKKNLEQNYLFSKVEFPILDLTKIKDIPFAVKLSVKNN